MRANQILLDHSLDYVEGVSLSNSRGLVSKERMDKLVDESRKRIYRVLDSLLTGSEDTFTTPENMVTGQTEVFYNGALLDLSTLTFPASNQVQLPFFPTTPPLFIHYLPATGVRTGHTGRIPATTFSSGGTLSKPDVNGRLVLSNTTGGAFTLELPDMDGADGYVARFYNLGPNTLTVDASAGDTIDDAVSIEIAAGNSVVIRYVRALRRWIPKTNVEVFEFTYNAQISADEPLMSYTEEV